MGVIKRDGSYEPFNTDKIQRAIQLSASRVSVIVSDDDMDSLIRRTVKDLSTRLGNEDATIDEIHLSVENVLWSYNRDIYREYRSYNNYKRRFNHSFNNILKDAKNIIFAGDKENANKDSCIISTKMTLVSELVGKELYLEYELPKHLAEAHKNMDIYIHDAGHRFYNGMINCCLFDLANVLEGGFTLNNKTIKEPESLDKALDLTSDIIFVASSQQYGGFTLPELDTTLGKYAARSYDTFIREGFTEEDALRLVEDVAYSKIKSIQYKIECVNNAGGQTPFVTWTFGADTDKFARIISRAILKVRKDYMAIFPKQIYLHHNDISGPGKPNYDLYEEAIATSIFRMYPDFCSANSGYLEEVYNRCGTIISAMGCRAYLSPYWDKEGKERYIGRFNLGAVTLSLPRYAIQSNGDKDLFFDLVNKHFEYAMEVHELTYAKMRKAKAKSNPLLFCEGGSLLKLNPNDSIEPALESCTYSIGYIGLTEVSYLMTGKHLHEDSSFAIEVLDFINEKIEQVKKDTGKLIALYATPSEGLCDKLLKSDRNIFGEIPYVTDKAWYHNSFHVGSNFDINAIDKQSIEAQLFHRSNGGHIVYNEYPTVDNFAAVKSIVDYAMQQGLYYGVNLEIGICSDCGFEGHITETCPACRSTKVSGITRCCGYLGHKQQNGDTRYNEGKNAEVENRVKHFGVSLCE